MNYVWQMKDQYTIEKKVPLPELRSDHKYPFSKMTVGDSFLWEGKTSTKISVASNYYRKKLGFRFTIRAVEGGFRIWRVE